MTESPAELLEKAAVRLEELAFGFGAEEFWQRDIARADLSVGAREWAPVMGPAIAKPLVAWLRDEVLDHEDDPQYWADEPPSLVFAKQVLGEQ